MTGMDDNGNNSVEYSGNFWIRGSSTLRKKIFSTNAETSTNTGTGTNTGTDTRIADTGTSSPVRGLGDVKDADIHDVLKAFDSVLNLNCKRGDVDSGEIYITHMWLCRIIWIIVRGGGGGALPQDMGGDVQLWIWDPYP